MNSVAGRFMVDGWPATIQNIRVPMFVVATERDHVAPWRSVYKIRYLADTDLTFCADPGRPQCRDYQRTGAARAALSHRSYTRRRSLLGPDEWPAAARPKEGSWWVEWAAWLAEDSAPDRVSPARMGAPKKGYVPIADAPGTYVHQR